MSEKRKPISRRSPAAWSLMDRLYQTSDEEQAWEVEQLLSMSDEELERELAEYPGYDPDRSHTRLRAVIRGQLVLARQSARGPNNP